MINKKELQVFFLIGIFYTIPLLLWLILTPSLSEKKIFLPYSLPRFLTIILIFLFLLVFILGYIFSDKPKVKIFSSNIIGSLKSFIIIFVSTFLSLFLLVGSLCDIFQDINTLFLRSFAALFFILCFGLEFLIFQEIIFKGTIRQSANHSPLFSLIKEQRISLFVLLIIIGFSCAVGFHYIQGVYLGEDYPRNTFLFEPNNRFTDFYFPLTGSFDLNPYDPSRINFIGGYFPLGYFVAFLFSKIQPWELSLATLLLVFLVFLFIFIKKVLFGNQEICYSEIIKIFVIATMTYPILFVLDRANFDIIVFIFIALFTWNYQKGNKTLATLLLAVPIAMKGYAVFLLVIPLFDKHFRDVILTGGLVILLEVISLALFKDGLIAEFTKMINSFISAYSIAFETGSLIRFNSSLFTFFLLLRPSLISTNWFETLYFVAAIFLFVLTSLLLLFKHFPFWKNLMVISILMILLPNSSADYRLILLMIPLLLFLSKNETSQRDFPMTFLFGLLFIPKAYYFISGDVNLSTLLNPILLMLLLVLLLLRVESPMNNVVLKN